MGMSDLGVVLRFVGVLRHMPEQWEREKKYLKKGAFKEELITHLKNASFQENGVLWIRGAFFYYTC